METRVGFIEQKMDGGETVYGRGAEKIANQVELLKAKSMMKATHAIESEEMEESKASESRKDELNSRLASKLEGTKEEIGKVRKAFKTAGMKKGAIIGLGIALAGAAVRNLVFSDNAQATVQNEATEAVSGAKAVAEAVPTTATATEAVGASASMVHEVVKGDNLWNIIKKDLADSGALNGLDKQARLVAIDRVKDKFANMSAEQLRTIGIGSGDANIIEIGENINLGSVYESLSESDVMSNSIAETVVQAPAENVVASVATENIPETTSHAEDQIENVVPAEQPAKTSAPEIPQAPSQNETWIEESPDYVNPEELYKDSPQSNEVPQKTITPEESHRHAVEEALHGSSQSNLADTEVETEKVPEPVQKSSARFRVVNYEVMDKGTGKLLDAAAVVELGSSEYLTSNKLTGQQYDYLDQQYGKEIDTKMRKIFDHSREEQNAFRNERARARANAQSSAKLNRKLWGKILSGKFQRSEMGRDMMRDAGRVRPIETHRHGFVEWEGNPRGRIVGIKNMEMKEILSKRFAKAKGLDSIETTNRHQFLSYVKELLRTVSPHERETVYEYALRATAATKNS